MGAWSDYQSYLAAYPSALCKRLEDCGLMDHAEAYLCTSCFGSARTVDRESIQSGAVAFDKGAASSCLSSVSSMPCKSPWWVAAVTVMMACPPILVPQVELGAPCFVDHDCRDKGAYCVGPPCSRTCQDHQGYLPVGSPCIFDVDSEACDRRAGACAQLKTDAGYQTLCAAYLADSQPCLNNFSAPLCLPSSFCSPTSQVCKPKLTSGTSCDDPHLGEQCQNPLACRQTSTGDAGFTGVCAALTGAGGSCISDSECAADLGCVASVGKCLPNAKVGDSCSYGQACANGDGYCQGASGSAAGVCALHTFAKAGQPCLSSGMEDPLCEVGFFCDETLHTCKAQAGSNEFCSTQDWCKAYLECDTNVCRDIPACQFTIDGTGSRCTSDTDCDSGACFNGLCAAPCMN